MEVSWNDFPTFSNSIPSTEDRTRIILQTWQKLQPISSNDMVFIDCTCNSYIRATYTSKGEHVLNVKLYSLKGAQKFVNRVLLLVE